jgi:Flp pilus assembly protein TadD
MRIVRLAASIVALAATGAGAAHAQSARAPVYPSPYPQTSPQMVQPIGTADSLASEIRLLAADPNNVQALVRAGELALKLEDPTAAAAFFTRASRIDPRNARVKAGEGSLLVSAERPGEALRHFAEAEALGGDVRSFAADRGLAYDLIGEQDRAQRDYRVALRAAEDDETRRRYALSLGISGKREIALKEIEPLLRKSDRGAWRSRAFILAMGGDKAGAERIATTMMPTGMAQGLQPFFEILPSLRPADRAFAVHFGEVRASPTRIADARMTPPLAALRADPTAPVESLATPRPPVVTVAAAPTRKERRSRKDRPRETIVAATTPPVVPLPAPPAYVPRPVTMASATPYQGPRYGGQPRPGSSATRAANLAAANAMPTPGATVPFAAGTPARSVGGQTSPQSVIAPALPSSVALGSSTVMTPGRSSTPAYSAPVQQTRAPVASAGARLTPTQLANAASAVPSPVRTGTTAVAPVSPAVAAPVASTPYVDRPAVVAAAPSSASAGTGYVAPVASAPAAAVATPSPVRSEDSILASIIAGINIPGTELGVAPERMAVTSPPPIQRAVPSRPLEDNFAAGASRAAVVAPPAERVAVVRSQLEKPVAQRKPAAKPVIEDAAEDRPVSTRKSATDKKALADKTTKAGRAAEADSGDAASKTGKLSKAAQKAADAKKLAEAKKAEEKRKNDPKLLEPQRYWVQVAGGANANDLSKQWDKLKTKNGKALAGKTGWVTPQRATNRVLTGPFKTDDEAQAFVNTLAKQGISGFVFASDAGQKVTKLPGK